MTDQAATVDVLIPTCGRKTSLAITLTGLVAQTCPPRKVIVSDQTEDEDYLSSPEIESVGRALALHGSELVPLKHMPRRGMAEQRNFLLSQSDARYVLFVDDDLLLEANVVGQMRDVIVEEGCGFVGSAPIGLSYLKDKRPHEQAIEFWTERVQPEPIRWETIPWDRHKVHNAANPYHVQTRLGLSHPGAGGQGSGASCQSVAIDGPAVQRPQDVVADGTVGQGQGRGKLATGNVVADGPVGQGRGGGVSDQSGSPQPEAGTAAWPLRPGGSSVGQAPQPRSLAPDPWSPTPATLRYKVAWIGACVMYDRQKLLEVGGYSWWSELPPEHCGEDVLVQLLLLRAYGGCGILPSGVYHLELPTQVVDRKNTTDELIKRFLKQMDLT